MRYRQLTSEERYALSTLRKQGFSHAYIARALGRHRSTIGREIQRMRDEMPVQSVYLNVAAFLA